MIIFFIKKAISYQKILYKKILFQNRKSLNFDFSKTWFLTLMMFSLISIFTLIFQLISIFVHLSLINTLRLIIFTTRFFNVRFLIRSKSSIHFINHCYIWIYFQKNNNCRKTWRFEFFFEWFDFEIFHKLAKRNSNYISRYEKS